MEVIVAGSNGINFSNANATISNPINIVNNFIGGGFTSTSANGVYLSNGSYVNIYFNSINLDANNSTGAALNINNISNIDVRNNNLTVSGTNSTGYALFANQSLFSSLDYNNYYKRNNEQRVISINNQVANSSSIIGFGGFNLNSTYSNPQFVSSIDLHTKKLAG